ncbi:hypothetical protein Tsp_10992 [Trichinella spiralis]|uniref:hypothetical protein n=1 Tax=Trichinella spiralis TaxID=6334 RepID=UPI0001EFC002|nr:hypothetical protein Tsp_10992 [Trichinella spiralis]
MAKSNNENAAILSHATHCSQQARKMEEAKTKFNNFKPKLLVVKIIKVQKKISSDTNESPLSIKEKQFPQIACVFFGNASCYLKNHSSLSQHKLPILKWKKNFL